MVRRLAVALTVALATLGLLSAGVVGAVPRGPATEVRAVPVWPAANVSANVTWNGVDVSQASSASTAFGIAAGQTADVAFRYTEGAGAPAITNASLVLLFLGLTLSAESIATAGPPPAGGWQLNWTFGSMIFVTQGVYEVDAQLLDANGSALFNEPFYVDAHAPYVFGSAILSMAAILGIAELLWIRTVLRYRKSRRGRYRFR